MFSWSLYTNFRSVFDDDDSGVSDKPGPVKKRPKLYEAGEMRRGEQR